MSDESDDRPIVNVPVSLEERQLLILWRALEPSDQSAVMQEAFFRMDDLCTLSCH